MNDVITIIVPVYNVEKYLKEAVFSVINQTYKNLEIILIDDGSLDNSGFICDELKNIDSRIKVIHQQNKGLSGARNTGLENATGKYIMFLDSDDKFELDACEKLYSFIEDYKADFIVGNYINMTEEGILWDKPVFDLKKYNVAKLNINDHKQSFYNMNSGVWNKIFRKSFLDTLKVKFVLNVPAEDAIFTTYCFMNAKEVYYIPNVVYNYRLRYDDSISTNCSKKYFLGISKAYRIIYDNFKSNKCLEYYRYFYAKSMNYILYKFIDTNKLTQEEKIEVLQDMKWFYMLGIELEVPTILKSVKYIIESISCRDYEQALKYCEILNQVRKMMPKELKEKMSKPNESTYQEIEENCIEEELLEKKEELLSLMKKTDLNILNIENSLLKIKDEKKSIARFGDGELDIILGRDLKFQDYNEKLADRLKEILKSNQDFCLIGIPDVLVGFENLTQESEKFWIRNMERTRSTWLQYLDEKKEYCTANITRLYIRYKDKSDCGKRFSMLKDIWKGKDVIICEGNQTRVGVGNDLLDECKSIKRIVCPAENAFKKYDEILNRIKQESKDKVIMIALGPTATVLAYDLAKEGYQALDLGHFDIEYEWFIRKSKNKEKIKYKYTNEVKGGNDIEEINDSDYKSEIIETIE